MPAPPVPPGPVPPAVAAGDATSAGVGADVLRGGGTAADAAVAAMLTACAAETVMTGLAGGGFATHWDPATARATTVDFFVAVPGLELPADRPVAPMQEIEVVFGTQPLEYWAGAASVAVPGVPAGLAEVHRRWGRLPWAEVVGPARALAEEGVAISGEQARVLHDVRAAMLLGPEGREAYAGTGRLIRGGELLRHGGLGDTFAALQDQGADLLRSTRPIGRALLALVEARGGALTARDLDAYEVRVAPARTVRFAGHDVHARTDLLDLLGTLARLPDGLGSASPTERVLAWVDALRASDTAGHTTNVAAVGPDGDACVITTTLGLGSGDWVGGMHLNSMLGEGELMKGAHPPGSRVDSMMTPLVAVDAAGLALAAGAAGGSRIRSALVQTLTGVLAEGLPPATAVERGRVNPVPGRVHAEPGVPEPALAALEQRGSAVERWPDRAAYFGGVSMVGRAGAAADPRRGGATVVL